MKKIAIISCIFFSLFLSSCWNNHIIVEDAWARPGVEGGNSAVYFAIDNPTENRDSLTSAETDVAENAEIHLSRTDDEGKMVMEHQEMVEIEPRTKVMFQPGGLHVMLTDLKSEMIVGDDFDLVLNFEDAGNIVVKILIKEP